MKPQILYWTIWLLYTYRLVSHLDSKIWLFPYPCEFCNPVQIYRKIINETWNLKLETSSPRRFRSLQTWKKNKSEYGNWKQPIWIVLVLSRTDVFSNTLHKNLKLIDLHPVLYVPRQKALSLNTCCIVRKVMAEEWIRSTGLVDANSFEDQLNCCEEHL